MDRSFVALMFFGFVAHLIIIVHAQNTTLITQTCNQTPNYNLCVSTLNSDPKTHNAKDMRDLANIMVLHVAYKATETYNHILGLLKVSTTDPKTKKLLNKCLDDYGRILTNWIREAQEGLSYKDYRFARDAMVAIPTDVELCEKSFVAPVKSPISDDSKAMDDLSKVACAIVSYIYVHPPL